MKEFMNITNKKMDPNTAGIAIIILVVIFLVLGILSLVLWVICAEEMGEENEPLLGKMKKKLLG